MNLAPCSYCTNAQYHNVSLLVLKDLAKQHFTDIRYEMANQYVLEKRALPKWRTIDAFRVLDKPRMIEMIEASESKLEDAERPSSMYSQGIKEPKTITFGASSPKVTWIPRGQPWHWKTQGRRTGSDVRNQVRGLPLNPCLLSSPRRRFQYCGSGRTKVRI